MQKPRVVLIVYWIILTYLGWATILSANGSVSLPLSLADKGDFLSLLRAAFSFIILSGIGLVANHYLIRRHSEQIQRLPKDQLNRIRLWGMLIGIGFSLGIASTVLTLEGNQAFNWTILIAVGFGVGVDSVFGLWADLKKPKL